jgi:hypothetical protein
MKKVLVLVAVSFFCWLSCKKTEPVTPVVKPCVRVYDTATTMDSYTETDTLSTFFGTKTVEFKLRLIKIATQTGTCDVVPTCSNLLTITNKTGKTVTIFYNLVGGPNVMTSPNAVKEEVVPSSVFATPNGPCISLADLKSSMKVRYN